MIEPLRSAPAAGRRRWVGAPTPAPRSATRRDGAAHGSRTVRHRPVIFRTGTSTGATGWPGSALLDGNAGFV